MRTATFVDRRLIKFFLHKDIRKLIKSREKIKNQIEHKKKNIIEEYSKYESEAYAPLTRHGYFPDRNADNYVVNNRYLGTYQGKCNINLISIN